MALKLVFLCLLLVLTGFLPSAEGSRVESEYGATHTLLRYLEAQSQGDISTMRSLIAGDLLEERLPLLSNPSYPAYLGETLADAEFSIDWAEELAPGAILIQASTTYGSGDIITRHYVLRKKDENALATDTYLIYEDYDPDFR